MDDLISRQAAIDFINAGHLCNPNEPRWSDNEVVNFLKSRPSAQLDNRLERIADIVEGTIDHLDRDDAMDMLYQIKEVLK